MKHLIAVGPAIAGSNGVSGQRVLDLALRHLNELRVAAIAIVRQIKGLSEADQRLVREILDLSPSGTTLMDLIEETLSW